MSAGSISNGVVGVAVIFALTAVTPSATVRSRVLPFDLENRADIVVPVLVGGRGPFRFLLDTGSSRTVVSSRLAATLGLVPVASTRLLTPSGRAKHPIAVLRKLEIGAAPPTNVLAMITPGANLPTRYGVDGIVGQDVLGAVTYTIDYVNRQIIWHLGQPTDVTGQRLLLRRSVGGLLVTLPQPSIGDLQLIPDSGAEGWVLFTGAAHRLPVGRLLSSASIMTLSGARPAVGVLIDQLSIGALTLHDQPAIIVERDSDHELLGDGLLPLHLFARVTFNPRAQQLIIEGR